MNIHRIWLMLFVPLLLSNIIVAFANNTINNLLLGAFTSAIVSLLIIIIVASLNVLSSGLNPAGSWVVFAVVFYLTMLYGIPLDLPQPIGKIKIGVDLVGNIASITPYPYVILIHIIGILLLYTGINIIIGGRTGG
jgi:hypothetical protein